DELLRVQRQRRQHRQRLRRRLRCDVDQSAVSSFQLPDGLASLTSGLAITGRMRCGFEWARLPARPTETLSLWWARLAHFRFTRSHVGCGVVLNGRAFQRDPPNPRTTVSSPRSLPVYAITGRMRCGFEWARLPARPTKTLALPWKGAASAAPIAAKDHRLQPLWEGPA